MSYAGRNNQGKVPKVDGLLAAPQNQALDKGINDPLNCGPPLLDALVHEEGRDHASSSARSC